MSNASRTLEFPMFAGSDWTRAVPDVEDPRVRRTLAGCWERTKRMRVPQFRDGDCESVASGTNPSRRPWAGTCGSSTNCAAC